MPDPVSMAAFLASAAQNPQIQSDVYGLGRGLLGGLGRVGAYVGEGLTSNIAQPLLNKVGDIGNQYLPQSVANLGTQARRSIYGLGQAALGAQPGQGLWDTALGRNMPQTPMAGGPGMQALAQLGMQQMSPDQLLQQNYRQQVQQPYRFDYANQAQQLQNRYEQQILPQLARTFGGVGAMNSGAFRRSATGAGANLAAALGALEEQGRMNEAQLNQQRLGDIRQYIGGQQQLGLQSRELGLRGTIAERENALRMLGAMGGAANQQQQNFMNQLAQAINAQGALGNVGMGQPYQQVQMPGQTSGMWQMLPGLIQGLMSGGRSVMGGV